MEKLLCKIFGHEMKQMCEGSFVVCCKRCGEDSDFTKFIQYRTFYKDNDK